MIELRVSDNTEFVIEFRHVSNLGKRPSLEPRYPIRAITTCVVVAPRPGAEESGGEWLNFIAIESAVCVETDHFSRYQGRLRSLRKVLQRSGALKDYAEQIWREYQAQAGVRPEDSTALDSGKLPKMKVVKVKLSNEERQQRFEAGAGKRADLRKILQRTQQ